jgi:hypothetical protein
MAPENRNTVGHRNAHDSSLELFETNWRAYRGVVDLDLMEHRALTVAIASLVKPLLPPGAAVADLGCGDLALLGVCLKYPEPPRQFPTAPTWRPVSAALAQ